MRERVSNRDTSKKFVNNQKLFRIKTVKIVINFLLTSLYVGLFVSFTSHAPHGALVYYDISST